MLVRSLQGFSGKKTQLGVKMSKTVKKVGSLNLKTLIEEDKLYFMTMILYQN